MSAEAAAPAPAPAPAVAPASPAPAPATAPTTPAPATTATEAPSFKPKPGMSSREAFEAFTAAKGANPKVPKPVQTQTALAPAPVAETPTEAPPRIQETTPTAPPEAQAEAPPEPEKTGEEKPQLSPEEEFPLPQKISEALNPDADPQLRRDVRRQIMVGRAYERSGMRLGDIKEYLAVAPSVDVLRDISAAANTAQEMLADFRDPSSEGRQRFLSKLAATDPDALLGVVGSVTEPTWLEKAAPQQFQAIATAGFRNLLENAKRHAARDNNVDLQQAVEILAEYAGIGPEAEEAPRAPAAPPEVMQELEQLRNEQQSHRAQMHNSFMMTAYQSGAQQVIQNIEQTVEAAMGGADFSEDARKETKKAIGDRLYQALSQNPHVKQRLDQLAALGRYDQQHLGAISGFLVNQAAGLLPTIAGEEIERMARITRPARQARQERVERVTTKREVATAGGRPSPGVVVKPIDTKGKSTKQVFDEFFAQRAGG